MEYKIQLIHFNNKKTHRILQNVGGPCPLLGLCNVLLLNNDIRVNQQISSIKFKDLTYCLKDHLQKLFERNMGSKNNINESQMANAIQNIEDCVKLFPKLEEGLDINIKFDDVTSFEYTSAIAMFDNYNIRLLHGWCVDPQDKKLHSIIKDKSYNEVVDFLTQDVDSKQNDEAIAQLEQNKAIVRQFLSDYQQQLTAHGLTRMHEVMNENEIGIFFRNNHFSAIYKRQGQIWELVTDEGIVDADGRITWQSLSQLSGDEQFVNNKFNLISQNINQQTQIESYNNTLKQKQNNNENDNENNNENNENKNDNKPPQKQGFSIEESNKQAIENQNPQNKNENNDNNNNNNNNSGDNNSNDKNNDKSDVINNNNNINNNNDKNDISPNKSVENDIDTAMAERIALQQQLGLTSGELERLQREQRQAMEQIEKQKKEQIEQQYNPYNNNNNNNSQHYSNEYPNQHRKPKNNPNQNTNYNNRNNFGNNNNNGGKHRQKDDNWDICWDYLSAKGCTRYKCKWRHDSNNYIDQRQTQTNKKRYMNNYNNNRRPTNNNNNNWKIYQ